jgi:hypothetical protein
MKETRILSINMLNKSIDTIEVRQILTQCNPLVRSSEGLVESTNSKEGFMMVKLKGDSQEIDKVENKIKEIKDLNVERLSL